MILELTKEDVKNLKDFFLDMDNKVEPYNIDNIIKKIYEEAELEDVISPPRPLLKEEAKRIAAVYNAACWSYLYRRKT